MFLFSSFMLPILAAIVKYGKFWAGEDDTEDEPWSAEDEVQTSEGEPQSIDDVVNFLPLPFHDPVIAEFHAKMETSHWSHAELDYTSDIPDYKKLSPPERHLIDGILGYFLPADGAINDNLNSRFLHDYPGRRDITMVFNSQTVNEDQHALTYMTAALAFKRDEHEVQRLVRSCAESNFSKQKMDFIDEWTKSKAPLYQRLAAFACAERIFFCTLFGAVYWFRSRGKLPSFNTANDFIKRDESLHGELGAYLTRVELSKMSSASRVEAEKIILEIVKRSSEIEDRFCDILIPEPLEGLTAEGLKQYGRLMADQLLILFGMPVHFGATCPYSWLASIDNQVKVNNFELRSGSYASTSVKDYMDWRRRAGFGNSIESVLDKPEEVDF